MLVVLNFKFWSIAVKILIQEHKDLEDQESNNLGLKLSILTTMN